jgi:hypothetical protein
MSQRRLAREHQHDRATSPGSTGFGRCVVKPALADIYDWFTEGFDTADLRAARSLLDES